MVFRALDQREEHGSHASACLTAGEQPVLAPDHHRPDRALHRVVVDGHTAVLQEDLNLCLQVQGVGNGFAQGAGGGDADLNFLKPLEKRLHQWTRLLPPTDKPLLGRKIRDRAFDVVEHADPLHRLAGVHVLADFERVDELAAHVCPTPGMGQLPLLAKSRVDRVGVRLKGSLESLQEPFGSGAAPSPFEVVDDVGSVVAADHRPDVGFVRLAGSLERHRGLIDTKKVRPALGVGHQIHQHSQFPGRLAQPPEHRRLGQFDSVPGHDLLLAVKGQVVVVLGNGDLRHEFRRGHSSLDDLHGGLGRDDIALAAPAERIGDRRV